MVMKFHPIFLLLLLVSPLMQAQDIVNPELAINDHEDINEKLIILHDKAGNLKISDILQDKNQIKFSAKTDLEARNIYWGKVSFHNHNKIAKTYYLHIGKNDLIDVYYVQGGKIVDQTRTGYLVPGDEKVVEGGSYYIPLPINASTTLDVYFRIEQKIHRQPNFDLYLNKSENWTKTVIGFYIEDLVFQLLLWLVILYGLYMYSTTNIKDYIYFAGFVFTQSVTFMFFTGLLREFILRSNPGLTVYFIPIALLSTAVHWFFVISYVNVKKHFPHHLIKIKSFVLANAALFCVALLLVQLTDDIRIASYTVQGIVGINLGLNIWFLFQIYESKYPIIKYYISGTVCMLLLSIFEIATWDMDYSTGSYAKYGIGIELIIFSFGLAHKKRIIADEKKSVLDKQINQLKVNQSLAQWQKEELEKIIDNRTEKIKEKNKILKTAIKDAKEAARVKSDFLSVMSHEIRTPMNAVIGMIHLLLSENPKKSQIDNLQTLKFSAENLLVLINDILDYSKVESGKVKLENIPFDLRELTKGIGNSYELKASENGIKFNILIDQKIPASLKGDPARITQILNNLISNAIKFTPKGSVKVLVNLINITGKKVKIEFSVEDSGIGISEDKLNLIFESFTQAHADTSRVYGGTGLGLAITKKLIHLFESQILVESEVGKGTKFSFSLLLEETSESPLSDEEDNTEKMLSIKGKNVLIVDDNYINLMMAKKFIEKWGMKCDTVLSGKEALTAIFNSDYDLILMDLQMPEMDGYETTSTIRSLDSPNINEIPIIAVSADTYENVHIKVDEVGMNDFLSKPFNPNELLNLVYKYCTAAGSHKEA